MNALANHSLIAKLPKLGPVCGWSRKVEGRRLARLWAKADDGYSGRAVLALTAHWDGATASRVQFWNVRLIHLPGTVPPAVQHFALAEVEPPNAGAGIRMVMLHIEEKQEGQDLPGLYGRAFKFETLDAAASQEFVLPGPQEVHYADFVQLIGEQGTSPEQYAARLFMELTAELEEARQAGNVPIPRSLSRRIRGVRSIEACEAQPVPRASDAPLLFAAGCCRHPGVTFDRGRADAALAAIAARAQNGEGLDLVVMLGDQIYVDAAARVLDGEERLEKYALRYDSALGSPGFHALAATAPVYMVADDHEIRDNWPNDTMPAAEMFWDTPVEWAWRLYLAHQRWHGPDRPSWAGRPRSSKHSFWYNFEERGVPFFAFDARFERRPNGGHIVGREQMAAFKVWLAHVLKDEASGRLQAHVPKFVLSGSVFAPGLEEFRCNPERARQADNWQAFPADQARVARLVAQSGAQNVVFLSGDYHCAAVGELDFGRCAGYAIVAAPLYAPYPFANALERDVAAEEDFRDQKGHVGRCTAEARAFEGLTLIRVRRPRDRRAPDDWEIDVEFYRDSGAKEPHLRALLARGRADWMPSQEDATQLRRRSALA